MPPPDSGSSQAGRTLDLAAPPRLMGERALRAILMLARAGRITVDLPSGARIVQRGIAPGPEAHIAVHRWRGLRRLVFGGAIGFAEGYMEGDWSSNDVAALLEWAVRNERATGSWKGRIPGARLAHRARHALRRNSRRGSRRNIAAHYDLGNDFYRLWLDRSMAYSSALYEHDGLSLEAAQAAKNERIVALLGLPARARVLEIGCGWGGLAERLAREKGCDVTAITLSREQLGHARARLDRTGVGARAEVRLQDYRDVSGRFDRIVSVEMIEAVGERYWPSYFSALRRGLADNGRAVIQAITIDETRFSGYRRRPDFIQRYVFPGGMLPTKAALAEEAARAGLRLETCETFGASYARTLREWTRRFEAAGAAVERLGFDERFRRMWLFYLAYCEAGFRTGTIDVGLYSFAPR